MRLSVECAFPHLRKRGTASRKSAFCYLRLTEKRTLGVSSSRKSAFCPSFSRKGALWPDLLTEKRTPRSPDRTDCVFPSRCGAREVWGNPPPGCGALWRMAQLGKCARATPRQPAGRLARGSANLGSESDLTERRTLPNQWAPECGFPSRRDRRMRFSVRVPAQNALFRHVAAPGRCGATPRQAGGRLAPGPADLGSESGLTERRTLPDRWGSECAFP